MRAKLLVGAGFAAGYVLGARAGGTRYEALARSFRQLKDDPSVQGTAGLLQAQVAGAAESLRRMVGAPPSPARPVPPTSGPGRTDR